MSGPAVVWARAQQIESAPLKSLLNAIAARCNRAGETVAGQAALSSDTGVGVRQVKRNLAILEALGLIERHVRSRGARGRATDKIVLAMSQSFTVTKTDLAEAAVRHARKVTFRAIARGLSPHLAQGDTGVTPNRCILEGRAKLHRKQSNQGESFRDDGAKPGDAFATIEGGRQAFDPHPLGPDLPTTFPVSPYARHRAAGARMPHGRGRPDAAGGAR